MFDFCLALTLKFKNSMQYLLYFFYIIVIIIIIIYLMKNNNNFLVFYTQTQSERKCLQVLFVFIWSVFLFVLSSCFNLIQKFFFLFWTWECQWCQKLWHTHTHTNRQNSQRNQVREKIPEWIYIFIWIFIVWTLSSHSQWIIHTIVDRICFWLKIMIIITWKFFIFLCWFFFHSKMMFIM